MVDRLIVVGLMLGGLVYSWPRYLPAMESLSRVDWIAYAGPLVVAIVAPFPLLARRTRPLVMFGVAIAIFALSTSLPNEAAAPVLVVFLMAYSVCRYTTSRPAAIAAIGLARRPVTPRPWT